MKLALFLTASFVAIALFESALGLYGPRAAATEADWQAASARVRGDLQADDLIVFAPTWVDQTGRKHLGDRMPVSMVARADDDRYGRIWELSIRGARSEDTKGLVAELEEKFGRVTVRRFTKPAQKVLRDLVDDFASAEVGLRSGDAAAELTPCIVDGNARHCGPIKIGPRVLEIDYRPRRGILAPLLSGKTVVITYNDVPAGKLVGYVGLHDYYARKSADGVVTFRASVDDSQSVTLPVRSPPANEAGGAEAKVAQWHRYELDLGPGTHRVRFELSSDMPASRLPGFSAEVRAP